MPPTAYDSLSLLRAGIPLTLLLDLAEVDPQSAELYRFEEPDGQPSPWLSAVPRPADRRER